MGAGDDTFVWDPGDGSDVVEGQDGADTMLFNGAGGGEQVDLSANGNRLRFFRTQGAITMDTAGVERVDFNALGGADLVTVNDLSGTDVSDVRLDLAGTLGGATGDGQTDRVVVNATDGEDAINVQGDADVVKAERAGRVGRGPPPGGRERPARDQHPRGQGRGRLQRPGRRGDPAPRRRHPRPLEPPTTGGHPMRRLIIALAVVVAVLGLAACGGGGYSSDPPPAAQSGDATATVSVEELGDSGRVLVDSAGKALYAADEEAESSVVCTGACTSFWIPLTIEEARRAGTPSRASSASSSVRTARGKSHSTESGSTRSSKTSRERLPATGSPTRSTASSSPGTSSASATPPTRIRTAMTPAARSATESPVAAALRWGLHREAPAQPAVEATP